MKRNKTSVSSKHRKIRPSFFVLAILGLLFSNAAGETFKNDDVADVYLSIAYLNYSPQKFANIVQQFLNATLWKWPINDEHVRLGILEANDADVFTVLSIADGGDKAKITESIDPTNPRPKASDLTFARDTNVVFRIRNYVQIPGDELASRPTVFVFMSVLYTDICHADNNDSEWKKTVLRLDQRRHHDKSIDRRNRADIAVMLDATDHSSHEKDRICGGVSFSNPSAAEGYELVKDRNNSAVFKSVKELANGLWSGVQKMLLRCPIECEQNENETRAIDMQPDAVTLRICLNRSTDECSTTMVTAAADNSTSTKAAKRVAWAAMIIASADAIAACVRNCAKIKRRQDEKHALSERGMVCKLPPKKKAGKKVQVPKPASTASVSVISPSNK